jgi:hypothetical protein
MTSQHISVVVEASVHDTYGYARNLANLARWAHGLAQASVDADGDVATVQSPMGQVQVTFAARNEWGVLDHDVTLPDGHVVHNPLRVVAHPAGAEVVFTLRQLGLSEEEFSRDAATVADDLARLKTQVEGAVGR